MALSPTYYSSKSPIIMNVGVDDAICLRRSFKVSSSPFLIVAKHLNASKISCSTSLLSPKLSLLSQTLGGRFDASRSI
jgi:hypothetical protein